MKSLLKIRKTLTILLANLILMVPFAGFSQEDGSGNVEKETRTLPPFDKIEVGSAFTVILSKGDPSVIVETDDNLTPNIETLVKDGSLIIDSKGIKNPTSLKVYVTAPIIKAIYLNGAARLESNGILEYPELFLDVNGASRANIEVNCDNLITHVNGASRVTLRGDAIQHVSEVAGASSVNALLLKTNTTSAQVKGAGKITVFAKNELVADVKEAGSIRYFDNPDIKRVKTTGQSIIRLNNPDNAVPTEANESLDNDIEFRVFEDGDSTFIKLKELQVHVKELDDETRIELGRHNIEIDDEGNVKVKRNKKEKYDGHWGGVDLGVNGLIFDNSMTPPDAYNFLDQKMERSINFALNLFEQNFNLANENFGLTTGLGLEWNNYRLKDNVVLDLDDEISGRFGMEEDTNWIKSKFVTTYLTLPLMFELQTNSMSKTNSFHIGVGVLSGLRIGTHTKNVYQDGDKETDKERGATAMNPFKLELMARLGWGKINLYGKYAITELFKENRGPEAFPFSVGISLLNW